MCGGGGAQGRTFVSSSFSEANHLN